MRITDALLAEHATLYAQLDYLERAAGAAPDPRGVHAQAALLAASLLSHADLEDELLFDEVEPHVGPLGPLAVMRAEHEEVKSLLDALQAPGPDDDPAPLLYRLVEVARSHFAKEEQILFPLAESVLSEAELEAAGERWFERRFAAASTNS